MDFTMTRNIYECYKTQRFANDPDETQPEREEKDIDWLLPYSTLTNSQACQVVEGTDPPTPIENWDTAYTDEEKKGSCTLSRSMGV